ncbi:MAG: PAS domain S-box protein [bacterium]
MNLDGKTKNQLILEIETLRKRCQELESQLQIHNNENSLAQYFYGIINHSIDAIIGKTVDGKILTWNKGAEQIYGYQSNEVIGKHVSFLVPPGYQDDLPNVLIMIKDGKHVNSYITKHKRKDNKIIDVLLSISIIKDLTDKIIGVSMISRDISAIIKFESELTDNLKRYQNAFNQLNLIIENLPDPTFVLDQNRKVIAWNRELEKFTGVSKSEVMGKSNYRYGEVFYNKERPVIIDLIWEDKLEELGPYYKYINKKNDFIFAETFLSLMPRKRDAYILIKAVPMYDDSGKFIGAIETLRNVSEWNMMETKLMQANKMEAIAQLSVGVAHEVRNPLNSIIALVEVLNQQYKHNDGNNVFIDQINLQVERLTHLMNDLLELGKISKKEEFTSISLKEICNIAIGLWNDNPLSNDFEIEFLSNKNEDIDVLVDTGRFQQVIINILDNAANHSPKKSKIIIKIQKTHDDKAAIYFTDKGTGIPEEYLFKIFEPFFTLRQRGTGLGLSIVDNIIKNHSGSIRAWNNDPPPGCTFEIILPLNDKGISL